VTASFQEIKFEIANSTNARRVPAAMATKIQLRNCGRDFGSPSKYSDKYGSRKWCDGSLW
jgi:hypothetical protein